jgi:hypothetical protein
MIKRLTLTRSPVTRRTAVAGVGVLVAVVVLTACGGASTSSTGATATTSAAASSPAAGSRAAGPAASGTIAAITGTTMQLQSQQSGQVAVAWSPSTTFTQTVADSLTNVQAGDCVTALAATGTAPSAASFTASSVSVTQPTNGSCTAGLGGGGGGGGAGQRPSGAPSGGQRPSGAPSGAAGRAGAGAVATGTVSSVSGSTLVIAAHQPGSSSTAPTNKTVTVDSSTKITTMASTTASSLQVGRCASAQGTADSTGTVAATSVLITDPVNGQCTVGFGGFGGPGTGGSSG